MDDKQMMKELVMRFSYSLVVLVVYFAGAVVFELFARGARWLGVSDLSYYMMSAGAHIMFLVDLGLLIMLLFRSARNLLKREQP